MGKTSRNLAIFFAATFIWTWAFYFPIAAGHHNPHEMPWLILLILGGMGPSLIGVILVLLTFDKERRRDYWRRCFSIRRIGLRWWLVIFCLFPLISALAIAIDVGLGGSLPGMEQLKSLIANPLTMPLAVFLSFMSGPWSEEFGWRGYALDPLMKKSGLLAGTVILGVIWGVWHLPLFFMADTWHAEIGFKLTGFWAFILLSIGLSLLMTWVYLNTGRSILSAMMMHFASNFTSQLLAPSSVRYETVYVLLVFLAGLTMCLLMLRRKEEAQLLAYPEPAAV